MELVRETGNRKRYIRTRMIPGNQSGRRPKLLDQMWEALESRYSSRRTVLNYPMGVKRFVYFQNMIRLAEMADPYINAFLTNLAVEEKVSVSRQKQVLCALPFLYRHVLSRELCDLNSVIRSRKPERLPVVMT